MSGASSSMKVVWNILGRSVGILGSIFFNWMRYVWGLERSDEFGGGLDEDEDEGG